VIDTAQLHQLDAPQLREMVRSLMSTVVAKEREIAFKQATIDKITHEMAVLKRLKFAAKSEHFNAEQKSLLEETIDADLAALQAELDKVAPTEQSQGEKKTPKRQALPANLPRRDVRHEPENTTCSCGCALKRIGEDVAEKLDYTPGVFTVERHVRGKWVCARCETLVQAPVAPHIIDKGRPRPGCWRRCWSPSSAITCRCTGRNASSSAPDWPSRARRSHSGSANAARNCSRWSTR
jgi:transposase